ncbi:MAG: hypothetical protein FWD57_15685 [Polyangiaceae bacterium]|nr:hypothetical protein [Polyangiaceae bacterium]
MQYSSYIAAVSSLAFALVSLQASMAHGSMQADPPAATEAAAKPHRPVQSDAAAEPLDGGWASNETSEPGSPGNQDGSGGDAGGDAADETESDRADGSQQTQPDPPKPRKPPKPPVPFERQISFWQIGAGGKARWITSPGFDPFSVSDCVGDFSARASRTLMVSGSLTFAAGASFEYGEESAQARDATAGIEIMRPGLHLEARYHLHETFYASLSLAPRLVYAKTWMDDDSANDQLKQKHWLVGVDASVGVAWRFAYPGVGFWLTSEFGYGLVQSADIELKTSGSPNPQKLRSVNLGGPFLLVGLALTL